MPRTFWLFSIRHTTTIFLVDSNLNMTRIQGDLRHMDRSTTITNRDAFNTENTVTEQRLLPTMPLDNNAPTPLVSPNPSAARHEHDVDITPSTSDSEMPASNVPGTRGSRPASVTVEMTTSVHSTVSISRTMADVFMLTSIPSGEDFTF